MRLTQIPIVAQLAPRIKAIYVAAVAKLASIAQPKRGLAPSTNAVAARKEGLVELIKVARQSKSLLSSRAKKLCAVSGFALLSTAAFAQTADLSVNLSGPLSVNGGANYTYTAIAGNSGPGAANNAVFTDNFSTLPIVGTVVATCTGTTGGAVCPASFTGGNNLSAIIPTFPSGSTVTMTFTVQVQNGSSVTSMSNTATIAVPSGTTETTPGNNSATVGTSIVPQNYDIQVLHSQTSPTMTVGTPTTYTVTYTNISAAGAGTAIIAGRDDASLSQTAEAVPFISPTVKMTHNGITCVASGGAACPASFSYPAGSYSVSRTASAAIFTYQGAVIPPGGALTFTYTATPSITNTDYCGTYTAYQVNNTAKLDTSYPVTDSNAVNNSVTVVSGPTPFTPPACVPGPDMGVTKTQTVTNLGNIAITPGSNTYKVVFANNGAGTAQGVTFRDMVQLPPNSGGTSNTILGSYDYSWTCTATAGVVCPAASGSGSVANGNNNQIMSSGGPVNNWAAGATLTYDFVFSNITVPLNVCGITGTDKMQNYADISASTTGPDPVSSNGVVRVKTDFTFAAKPCVDLAVSKTASTTSPKPGAPLTFTVTVSNSGASTGAALNVPITDTLPNGFLFASSAACTVTTAGTGATTACGAASVLTCTGCASGGGTLAGTIPNIAPGGVVTYTIVGTASTNHLYFVGQQNVVNVATYSADYGDTNTTSNNASVNFDIKGSADLSITKTDSKTSYTPGTTNAYTIVVSNAGPDTGNGAILKDPAITGLTGVTVTCDSFTGGAACPAAANTTTALLQGTGIVIPTLPVGGSVTFTVTGTVPVGRTTPVVNVATVATTANVTDPAAANNSASDTDTLAITITAVDDPAASLVSGGTIPATGGVTTTKVTANDDTNGNAIVLTAGATQNATLTQGTIVSPPAAGSITLSPTTGLITVAAGTTPGTYTVPYTVCTVPATSPVTCSTANATVVVAPVINPVTETGAAVAGIANPTAITNIRSNDFVNGVAATSTNSDVSIDTSSPALPVGMALNASTGAISTTAATPAGVYTIIYKLCDKLSPVTCATVTDTVTITSAPIAAITEAITTPNGATGGTTTTSVITNDTLNGVTPTLGATGNTVLTSTAPTPLATAPAGNTNVPTINPLTGTVTVPANTPAGVYPITYTICEKLNPTNCATVTDNVTVPAAAIAAITEAITTPNGATGGTTTTSVITNDTLNGVTPTLGATGNTVLTSTAPTPLATAPAGNTNVPTINPLTGTVTVPANTPAGVYPITYTICEKLNPTNCATVTDNVTVPAAAIAAITEAITTPNGATGGTTTTSVITNDTLNGVTPTLGATGNTVLTSTAPTPLATAPAGNTNVPTINPLTGTVTVPANTPAGVYPITYTICEKLNPTNCATVTDNVTVPAAAIAAITEAITTPNGATGGTTTTSVITNDTLNGVTPTLGATGNTVLTSTAPTPLATAPAGNTNVPTINPLTGTVTVPANTPAGVYPITYTICEKLNPTNCATVTDNVTVPAAAIAAITEAITTPNGATGGTTTTSVITNDTLNGVTPTLGATGNTVLTSTAPTPLATAPAGNTNVPTINPLTGTVTVPANTPAGVYPITYTICEKLNPTNCATVTDNVTVPAAAIAAITEAITTPNGATGGTTTTSVITNDTLNGVTPTLGATGNTVLTSTAPTPLATAPAGNTNVPTINPLTGTVTVPANTPAGVYPITYTICEKLNPTNCATVTDNVTVPAAAIAAITEAITTPNGATGGTTTTSVITNDTLNGVTPTLGATGNTVLTSTAPTPLATAPAGNTNVPTINPLTGTVTVPANTPAGVYPITYTICEKLNPTNCATVTDNVTVPAAAIAAITEAITTPNGATGGTTTTSVITNDTLNGVTPTLGATGNTVLTSTAPTPLATAPAGNTNVPTINPLTGTVTVPANTPAGVYPITYTICEKLNPTNCATVTDNVTVPAAAIAAITEAITTPNGATGGTTTTSVITNDTLNGVTPTLGATGNTVLTSTAPTPLATAPAGNTNVPTINPLTGTVTVPANTPAGVYPITYTICEKLNPTNCATVTDNVTVPAAAIAAITEAITTPNGATGGTTTTSVITNDTLNGVTPTLGATGNTVLTSTAPTPLATAPAGNTNVPTINPLTGTVTVPANTPAGVYPITYTICEKLNPTNCATVTDNVTVPAAAIAAITEAITTPNGATGGTTTTSVITNDTLNGVTPTLGATGNTVLTSTAPTPLATAPAGNTNVPTINPLTGTVTVPANTPAGVYPITYTICEKLNPTNCATVTDNVTVPAAAIAAITEAITTPNGATGGTTTTSVITNDTLNGVTPTLGATGNTVLTSTAPTPLATAPAGNTNVPTINPLTGTVTVPANTPAGVYPITYTICEKLNPTNCATVTDNVTVPAAAIAAITEAITTPNGATGGTTTTSVITNDTLNGVTPTLGATGNTVLTSTAPTPLATAPAGNTNVPTINPLTGTVTVPANTPAGVYPITYTICEKLNPTNCATVTDNVTVPAAAIAAITEAITTPNGATGGTTTTSVITNDTLNGVTPTLGATGNTVLTSTAPTPLATAPAGNTNVPTINPLTGTVTVPANTPAGVYPITYTICEKLNPTNCATVTDNVTVPAAAIAAITEAITTPNGATGGTTTTSVITNDTLNGVTPTLGATGNTVLTSTAPTPLATAPAGNTNVPTINPLTGTVTVPANTPAGVYPITYTICEKLNPTNCATVTDNVTVPAAAIAAITEAITTPNGATGGTTTTSVITNDTLNGVTPTLGATGNTVLTSTAPTPLATAPAGNTNVPTINPLTGTVTVPANTPAGVYPITYTICEKLNPTNCATVTDNVTVPAAAIAAITEAITTPNGATGGTTTTSVITNDTLNGVTPTLGATGNTVLTSTAPTPLATAPAGNTNVPTINPLTGTVTVPANTPAGVYPITYTICEKLNPTNCATVTDNVTVPAAAIAAITEAITTPNGATGGTTTTSVITNDTLNGVTPTLGATGNTVLTSTAPTPLATAPAGNTNVPTINPLTGTVTVPANTPAGVYPITYTICEKLNPTNCATVTDNVTVPAAAIAAITEAITTPNGATGGTTTTSVITNDTLNGVTPTLGATGNTVLTSTAPTPLATAPAGNTNVPTINPLTGTVTVPANTPAGVYPITYTICEKLNPTNCATVTDNVTVPAAAIAAITEAITTPNGATGGTTTTSVITNDTLNGVTPTLGATGNTVLTSTAPTPLATAPAGNTNVPTINPLTGTVTVPANTPAGVYPITYTICEKLNPTNCATVTDNVTVPAAAIAAITEAITTPNGATGGTTTTSVITNDTLNGVTPTLGATGNTVLTSTAPTPLATAPAGNTNVPTINPLTGTVTVPANTPAGVYPITYTICEKLNPTNCATVTDNVTVPAAAIAAITEAITTPNGATGGTTTTSVITNDTLNGVTPTLGATGNTVLTSTAPTPLATAPAGNTNVPTINPLTGTVTVPANTPAGVYPITYTICEKLNPTNCATVTDNVTVPAAAIAAITEAITTPNGATGGTTTTSVITNDTLNGVTPTLGATGNTVLTSTAPTPLATAPAGNTNVPTINPLTGTVTVPANTPAGVYPITYTICEKLNPTNCATVTDNVTVPAAAIAAITEAITTPNGATGGTTTTSVITNDTLNGVTPTLGATGNTVLTSTAPTPLATAPAGNTNVPTINPLTGTVTVPANTPAGVYPITYTICEKLNPTNCATVTDNVTVPAAAIAAITEAITTPNGATGGTTTTSVITNDTLNGVTPTLGATGNTVLTSTAPTPLATAPAGNTNVPTINPLTGTVTVPANTPAGVYPITYTICEKLNPTNCATVTDNVTVPAAAIAAITEAITTPNGATGGTTTTSVITNDTLNGVTPTLGATGNTVLTSTAPTPLATAPAGNTNVPTINPLTGTVTVPANTPAGVYPITYTICEKLNPTNCATVTDNVTVPAAAIAAITEAITTPNGATGGTTTTSVITNDTLNGVTPTLGATGNTVLTSTAPTPLATAPAGNTNVPTINPLTGTVTVPANTPAGVYPITYTICEKLNPTNCATVTDNVTVPAAAIAAITEAITTPNGATGGTTTTSVITNDTLNGVTPTLGATGNTVLTSTAPTPLATAPAGNTNVPTINPLTGTVTVPANTPAGVYPITYTICEKLNPTNCATVTDNVTVPAAAIAAITEAITTPNGATGGTTTTSVITNDTLNGVTPTLGATGNTVLTSTAPTPLATAPAGNTNVPTINPLTGTVTVPANTPAGVYPITYTICEKLNPTNCATVTDNVTVPAAAIAAITEAITTPNGATGGTTTTSVITNDTLNGVTPTLGATGNTVLTSTAPTPLATAPAGNTNVPTINPLTGTVTVPANTPAGVYPITYTICEKLNPTNCATVTDNVTVPAAAIAAITEAITTPNGATGGTTTTSVITNDTLNGVTPTLGATGNTVLTSTAPTPLATAPAGNTNVPTINPLTGTVTVPANTPAGVYPITYTICEKLNPTNCATVTDNVTVPAAAIAANNDTIDNLNGAAGGASTTSVITNDSLNGVTPVLGNTGNALLTVKTPAIPVVGAPVGSSLPAVDPATGVVSVPAGTPAGMYTIVYTLCEKLNSTNCKDATISVTVQAPSVKLVKTHSPATFVEGSAATYTLQASNTGSFATVGAYTVTDLLPAGIQVLPGKTATGAGWICTTSAVGTRTQVSCTSTTVLTATTGMATPITVPVLVTAGFCGAAASCDVINTATITGGGDLVPAGGNSGSDTASVQRGLTISGAAWLAGAGGNSTNPPNPNNSGLPANPNNIPLPGYVAIVLDTSNPAAPIPLAAATVDALGNYTIQNVPVATAVNANNYRVVFVDPTTVLQLRAASIPAASLTPSLTPISYVPVATGGSQALDVTSLNLIDSAGRSIVPTSAGAINNATQTSSSVVGGLRNTIKLLPSAVTGAGNSITQIDLPIDPSGVVYDSVTRQQISDPIIKVCHTDGTVVSTADVLGGASYTQDGNCIKRQYLGSSGVYVFYVNNPGNYSISYLGNGTLLAPASGSYPANATPFGTSAVIPPLTGPASNVINGLNDALRDGRPLIEIQTNSTPPTANQSTSYFTTFALSGGATGGDIINNHLAIDPAVLPQLAVSKTGDKTTAELGDSVRYTITVKRLDTGTSAVSGAQIIDYLPAGFRYIDGTAQVNGISVADPTGKPAPKLVFTLGSVPASGTVTLTYRVRLGVGAMQGSGINRAQAIPNVNVNCAATPTLCSNEAQYKVKVTGGVFTSEACITGKVYLDCNNNHVQDGAEMGIPGVRMYLENGINFTTDGEGKYSYCGLPPRTSVLVLDQTTLPRGSVVTTSSSRNAGDAMSLFLDLKNGDLQRADFVETSCSDSVIEQVTARQKAGATNPGNAVRKDIEFDSKPANSK